MNVQEFKKQVKHEENLINLFEGQKSKINWEYLKKFNKGSIPNSFLRHFSKEINQSM